MGRRTEIPKGGIFSNVAGECGRNVTFTCILQKEEVRFSMILSYSPFFWRISLSYVCFGCYRSNTKPGPGVIGGFL